MKIKKFNEDFRSEIDPYNEESWGYNIEEIKENFRVKKQECLEKLEDFERSLDVLTKMTSPLHWRTTGHFFTELRHFKKDLENIQSISEKDLENPIVLKELES